MTIMQPTPVNVLVSYAYWDDRCTQVLRAHAGPRRLIVDSGAFTAWSKGRVVELDEYCRFLDGLRTAGIGEFIAVQLDKIGDPEVTARNYELMLARGYRPMPVFQRGESRERLEQLYQTTDYIMLGGIAFGATNKEYAKWCLMANRGRKLHLLGFSNWEFMAAFKPESVDSTSWNMTARYGNMAVYDGRLGVRSLVRGKRTPLAEWAVQRAIVDNTPGLTLSDLNALRQPAAWRGWGSPSTPPGINNPKGMSQYISTHAWLEAMRQAELRFGTKLYLACSATADLQIVLAWHEQRIKWMATMNAEATA